MRLAVVSPHCDDAVFGCGELLAAHPGALVVTVFAGRPATYGDLTRWDRASGFTERDDPVARRREEDRDGLATLGAGAVWLDFCDAQYAPSPSVDEIWPVLEATVAARALGTAAIPLGLFHSDHHLAREASLRVMRRHPGISWLAYEEAIYRRVPGLVDEALEHLRASGLAVAGGRIGEGCTRDDKRRAVRCYRSQLLALATPGHPGVEDIFEPERYWLLRP